MPEDTQNENQEAFWNVGATGATPRPFTPVRVRVRFIIPTAYVGQEGEGRTTLKEIKGKLEPHKPWASLPRICWCPGRRVSTPCQPALASWWGGQPFVRDRQRFRSWCHTPQTVQYPGQGDNDLVANLFHLLGSAPMQSKWEREMSVHRSNSQTQVLWNSV